MRFNSYQALINFIGWLRGLGLEAPILDYKRIFEEQGFTKHISYLNVCMLDAPNDNYVMVFSYDKRIIYCIDIINKNKNKEKDYE